MKKKVFYIAIAAIAGATLVGCGSSKKLTTSAPAAATPTGGSSTAQQIQAMEEEAKLIAAQAKLDQAKFEAEQAKKEREAEAVLAEKQRQFDADQSQKKMEVLEVSMIQTPCIKELMNTEDGKYITGFASADAPFDEDEARRDALVKARNYIGEKFMGIAKNFSEEYKKSTTVPGGANKSEGDFERIVQTAGKTVLNRFLEERCDQMTKASRNVYRCYKAVRIPAGKLLDEIASESKVQGVMLDKQIARNTMDKILGEAEAEKDKEVQNAQQQMGIVQ